MRAPGAMTLLLAALLAGCGGSPASAGGSEAPASRAPVLSLDEVDAVPVENREETVAMAFDAEAAADLVESVPPDLDFTASAMVCVFLGPRQTTGWSLDLLTVTLSGDVLTIRARESVPRGQTRPEVTYPADCGLLTRAALPAGELTVRADDTVTGEFIADAVVEVPPISSGP
jgi:hypothetical protein